MMKLLGLSHLYMTVFLYNFSTFMVIPAITDVTMAALCPGRNECSLAIYLTGFQQAAVGLGTLVMMPLVGNLSDKYGRKPLLTLPMTLSIIPLVILAYSRTRDFFYAYFVLKTLTGMICEGSLHCLALAYVADNIPERRRASAFGILSGIGSSAFVCATLSARFLSTSSTFQIAAAIAVVAALYMKLLLPDSIIDHDCSNSSKYEKLNDSTCLDSDAKVNLFKTMPSVEDTISLLKSSSTFLQAAIVAFFCNLADVGLYASLMYYLKAQFQFNKNQLADLMMTAGIAGTVSQLLIMPILARFIGEGKLLSVGLFFNCAHMFLYSIAWSSWVPYPVALFSIFYAFSQPCIRSIASQQVGHSEQGKAQGCISGICSLANVVSPVVFTPLTALFLSEKAPIHFPGFSIMCLGFVAMIAFVQSIFMTSISSARISGCSYVNSA